MAGREWRNETGEWSFRPWFVLRDNRQVPSGRWQFRGANPLAATNAVVVALGGMGWAGAERPAVSGGTERERRSVSVHHMVPPRLGAAPRTRTAALKTPPAFRLKWLTHETVFRYQTTETHVLF